MSASSPMWTKLSELRGEEKKMRRDCKSCPRPLSETRTSDIELQMALVPSEDPARGRDRLLAGSA